MELQEYVKNPVRIFPLQFTGENFQEIVDFTKGNAFVTNSPGGAADGSGTPQLYQKITITTMHEGQKVDLVAGDWVIPEPDGVNFYPCKPDVFKKTYAKADDKPRAIPLKDILIAVGNWLQTDDVWITDKPGGNKINGFIESKPGTLTSRLTNPNKYRGEVIEESALQRIRKIVEDKSFDITDIIGTIKEILNEEL